MKKVLISIFIAIIICSIFIFSACASSPSYAVFEEGAFEMAFSEENNDAFAGTYHWSGQLDDLDILVPNTFKGAPVTALGGVVASGAPMKYQRLLEFKINFGDETTSALNCWFSGNVNSADEVDEQISKFLTQNEIDDYTIEEIVFNIHIGSNLQRLDKSNSYDFRYYSLISNDSEGKIVRLYSFNLIVDEDNACFYSDELGRMYYKEDNKLVTLFLYHNRDTFPEGSLNEE